MKVLIVGAGSIGVYLGTLLAAKNHEVILLGSTKLKKLHDTILINDLPYELPQRIYKMPMNQEYDFVFITSKLYDLQKNLKLLVKNKISTDFLASIQNGIVDEEIYKPYIDLSKFASISVFEGFRLVENQLIVSSSTAGWKTENSAEGKKISELLKDAGINCTTEDNLDSIKAEKTIMNCCVNLLSAVEKKTFFELCRNKSTHEIIEGLFDESYEVLSCYAKLKPLNELKKQFYGIVEPMRHYSSTYQDAIANKRTEADFLNGLIIKLGKKYGIKTPKNKGIFDKFVKMYPKSV
jgi:2-dehydropantoate 2-reductase